MIEQMPQWIGWTLILAFGALSFLISQTIWRSRTETKESYLVAGRRVSWIPLAGSIAATWLASQALFVVATKAYTAGWVGLFWFTVPNVASLVLFAVLVGAIRRKFPEGFTLSGMIAERSSRPVQRAYQVILMTGQTLQVAVQLTAGAVFLNLLTGIDHSLLVISMAVIVLAYTIRTGIKATILTDGLQVFAVLAAELGLAVWFATKAGGAILAGLSGPGGEYTSLFSGPGLEVFLGFGLVSGLGLLLGPFNDQAFWQRAWSGKTSDLRKAFILGAVLFSLGPLAASMFGLAAVGGGLDVNPETANVEGMLGWLPAWTVIPFAVSVFAAIFSTMDSQMSSIAAMVGHDLTRDPRNAVRNGRWAMVILMAVAVLIALPGNTVVALFSIFAAIRMAPTGVTALAVFTERRMSTAWTLAGLGGGVLLGVPLVAYGVLGGPVMVTFIGTLLAILTPGVLAAIGSRRAPVTDEAVPVAAGSREAASKE